MAAAAGRGALERPVNQREQRFWGRFSDQRGGEGVPRAIVSALTPFSVVWLLVALIVFLPAALILSFFVKRHAIVVEGGELVVLDLSFWRYRVEGERMRMPLEGAPVSLDASKLEIDGETFHPEPGWGDSAARVVELIESG